MKSILLCLCLFSSALADEVYFSPHGGCTGVIVNEIGYAKKTVLVQAYVLTSHPIVSALILAERRGVHVEVILDARESHAKACRAQDLIHAGVLTLTDGKHAIAHNKIIIVDDATLITGSFNFSDNAENQNAENLLVSHDPKLIVQYQRNWHFHEQHSTPYKP